MRDFAKILALSDRDILYIKDEDGEFILRVHFDSDVLGIRCEMKLGFKTEEARDAAYNKANILDAEELVKKIEKRLVN